MDYSDTFNGLPDSRSSMKRLIVCLPRLQITDVDDSLLSRNPLILENAPFSENSSHSENQCSKFEMILDKVVECPGCSLFLANERKCAQHLLQECLLPRNLVDSEAFRCKFTDWVFQYFYTHYVQNSTNNREEAMDTDESNYQTILLKKSFNIYLKRISFDLQCPVCEKYFSSAQTCYVHLFGICLYSKNSENGIRVSNWFSQYLLSDGKWKLDHIFTDSPFQDFGKRVVCKYCKKEFLDKECLMNHLRSSHRKEHEHEPGNAICNFCNFKAGSRSLLFKHFMEKHVKCGCGERAKTFNLLKMHLSSCPKRSSCLCPTCQEIEVEAYTSEADFEGHILACRRPVPLNLSIHDLFTECDICWQQILKCNLDVHVAKHIKFSDSAKRQHKNAFIEVNDLKDILSDQDFFKMRKLFSQIKSTDTEV